LAYPVVIVGNIKDVYLFGEQKVYACCIGACPIGGTFFDELLLIMIGFDRGGAGGQVISGVLRVKFDIREV